MTDEIDPIAIRHLVDVPDALPILARWYIHEWASYYGPDGAGDAEADLRAAMDRDRLPICLIAVDADGEVMGAAALKAESVPSHWHLSPWLSALLVATEHRGRGVGTALVAAVEAEARRLGYERLYTATDTAESLVQRRGWRAIGEAPTLRGTVNVYELAL